MRAKFTSYLIPFLFILFTPCFVAGQSLFEDLGGIRTDFVITSGDKDLEVIAQGIYSSGTSERIYWFQFVAHTSINEIPFFGEGHRKVYDVTFMDVEGHELIKLTYDARDISAEQSNQLYIYTMNVKNLPIVLLDKVKTINIVKYTKT